MRQLLTEFSGSYPNSYTHFDTNRWYELARHAASWLHYWPGQLLGE